MIHEILKILDTTDLQELEKQRITTDLLRLFNDSEQSEQLCQCKMPSPSMSDKCSRCKKIVPNE